MKYLIGIIFIGLLSCIFAKQSDVEGLTRTIADMQQTQTKYGNKMQEATEWLKILQGKNNQARKLLSEIFGRDMTSFSVASTTVTVTAYSARPEETDSTPDFTADLTNSRIGLLAVSRDLLDYVDYGQVVILPGYGAFRVSDTMNKRFKNRVDILHSSPRSAKLFGRHDNQKIMWVF